MSKAIHSLHQRQVQRLRQDGTDITKSPFAPHLGIYPAKFTADHILAEISVKLYRDLAAGCLVCCLLQFSLECHASKGSALREILRRDRNDQGTVGVLSGTVVIAHAVYRQPSGFGRGIHHITTRTHTEAVYTAPAFCLSGKLIICRAKGSGLLPPILGEIDHLLGMLDTQSHRKRLLFHGNLPVQQHGKGISCAVPDGKHHHTAFDFFLHRSACLRICKGNLHTAYPALFRQKICHLRIKPYGSAQADDFFTHMLNHLSQHIRTDVWFMVIQNRRIRAELGKKLQDQFSASQRIFHQSIQFAVRKCAGAALAKLYIGLHIQRASLPERVHLFLSLVHCASSFQQNRAVALPCQHQTAK